ncbi:MAG: Smr/MutS family protein [Alphaproteobacteria bacterium]
MTKKTNKPLKTRNKKQPDDEAGLWRRVAAGVTPLDGRHKNLNTEAAKPRPVAPPKTKPARSRKPVVAAAPPKPAPAQGDLRHGAGAGLDKSTAKKLKDGKRKIEARIDLHGMTQDQAHRALNAFIDAASHAARRCVLVITGKGGRGEGSVGVLREQVPRWLNQSPLRPLVLAFSYATPKDGGEGALYVLLKRKR